MTVAELGERLTVPEYLEWQAMYSVSPFGAIRGDIRIGLLGLQLARIHGAKHAKLEDYMPRFEPKREQSQAEMMRRWKLFAGIHNSAIGGGNG